MRKKASPLSWFSVSSLVPSPNHASNCGGDTRLSTDGATAKKGGSAGGDREMSRSPMLMMAGCVAWSSCPRPWDPSRRKAMTPPWPLRERRSARPRKRPRWVRSTRVTARLPTAKQSLTSRQLPLASASVVTREMKLSRLSPSCGKTFWLSSRHSVARS